MEQHPVPRNISGFQFHLVGDMTLKQFGYLAGGVILAYFIFKLPLPALITFPAAGFIALSGVAFAFVPIQERPLDRWLIAFIKSVYSPTQYLWRKNNPPLALLIQEMGKPITTLTQQHSLNHQVANQKLNEYLAKRPKTLTATINQREKAYVDKTLSLFNSSTIKTTLPQTPLASPIAPPPQIKPLPPITKEAPPVQTPPKNPPPPTRLDELEQKMKELLSEKEKLTKELTQKEVKTDEIKQIPIRSVYIENKKPETVKTEATQTTKDLAGMPSIPTVGNVIIGVVRDNLKRLLSGIIVSVKDPSGMSVRALRTNKLGQFAAATQLENGNYIIEIEDPQERFRFDTVAIKLDGNIFMPIEIIAKGSREILRDKLTKEIFGAAGI